MKNNTNSNIDRTEEMDVLDKKGGQNPVITALFTAFVIIVIGVLAYSILFSKKEPKVIEKKATQELARDPGKLDMSFETIKPKEVVKPQEPEKQIIIPEAIPMRPTNVVRLGDLANNPELTQPALPKVDPAYERKKSQGSMMSGGESTSMKAPKVPAPDSSVFRAKAGRLKNQDFLLVQGTKIHCTLETAIDSTVPGYTSCITARDVYSMNGNVVLLDRGTKITGQYKSSLKHGEARLYVKWDRAVSPNGATVELGSGGTGPLGKSGHSGYVNKHWWERFGNALLISIVGDSLGYTSDRTNNENFENTENTINAMATIAAEASIDIKPTIDINQGESIVIYVQRDLDFSSIYGLKYDRNYPH